MTRNHTIARLPLVFPEAGEDRIGSVRLFGPV